MMWPSSYQTWATAKTPVGGDGLGLGGDTDDHAATGAS
jgi:hypothetical protein